MNDKCDYMELHDCKNFNPRNHNFVMLQLNIRSILSNQTDLKRLLNNLEVKNSKVDIALLCETHLMKNTVGFVNIPNYTHIAYYRTSMKGGGTSILIRNNIPFSAILQLFQYFPTEVVQIDSEWPILAVL